MKFPKLKNPPLVETVCEFRFAASDSWDGSIAGRVYEQIKAKFPDIAPMEEMPSFEVHIDPKLGPTAVHKAESTRTQFRRSDKSALIQVDTRMLSANQMAPYPGWEEGFRPLIFEALRAFRQVKEDFELARIGLRYVNRIPLRPEDPDLDEYVKILPGFKGKLERPIQTLYQRYEFIHDIPSGILIHQTGVHRQGESTDVMLDLDFVSQQVSRLSSDEDFSTWLETAHACVIQSFNDSITADLYARL